MSAAHKLRRCDKTSILGYQVGYTTRAMQCGSSQGRGRLRRVRLLADENRAYEASGVCRSQSIQRSSFRARHALDSLQGGFGMRFSHLFGRTIREVPSDADLTSHQLSVRAGLIRQLAAGIYSYLPTGWRVLRKIEQIMRDEMDAIGGQELLMPVVHPAEVWRATGRYDAPAPGPALLRFRDRTGHDMVLAMTHEETATHLALQEIASYRQLPLMIYQIQIKFRDEPRSRGGLVRVREFTMKDAYSFHADFDSLDEFYPAIYQAYLRIFARCGVQVFPVEASTGIMGGSASHEFMVISEAGEDTLILCPGCNYAANAELADLDKGEGVRGPEQPMEKVPTPETKTIEAVANLIGVEKRQTLKAVFYTMPDGEVVFALIRGDLDVNEHKLSNLLGGAELRPATEEELINVGIVPGYASPVGLSGVRVIADDSIEIGNNYVAGANEAGYHYKNVNYPRDFRVDMIEDIALAREGDRCPHCDATLKAVRGIEAGHVFKLGTKYSATIAATFLDKDGQAKPLVMGSYGIGTGRLLACIIEQHHDDKGIIWPVSVAPFDVHIVSLGGNNPEVQEAADALYKRLTAAGYDVLYDDREETAGVKFNDADLIGIPVRLTVSRRTVADRAFEVKARWEDERRSVPMDEVEQAIDDLLAQGAARESVAAQAMVAQDVEQ
jgi:prolyl-tRNA synthetase